MVDDGGDGPPEGGVPMGESSSCRGRAKLPLFPANPKKGEKILGMGANANRETEKGSF